MFRGNLWPPAISLSVIACFRVRGWFAGHGGTVRFVHVDIREFHHQLRLFHVIWASAEVATVRKRKAKWHGITLSVSQSVSQVGG